MDLIDGNALYQDIKTKIKASSQDGANVIDAVLSLIEDAPTVNAVEVVRCKDCKYCEHWYADKGLCYLWYDDGVDVFGDGYCNYGKRREDEIN